MTLPWAKTMRKGPAHSGQMVSVVVQGVLTQEGICLRVGQWLITCLLAANVVGGKLASPCAEIHLVAPGRVANWPPADSLHEVNFA